jgi:hypothetical protein
MSRTNGHSAAPSREQIIMESTYFAAIYGCYDTSEAAQKSNLLTISVVDMAIIPGDPLPAGVTHRFYVMINGTGYMVTRSTEGYKVDTHDQTDPQRQERELRGAVLDAALWHLTGEGAGYHVGDGPEARNAALKELLEEGPEGEEPEARESSDPILHPVIREHAPDLSLSLAPGSEDEEGPQPLRQWAVEIGPYNRCGVVLFGYGEDGTPELITQDYEEEDGEEPEE